MSTLAERLHPARFSGMSPKMAAVVGYIVGEAWTEPAITSLCITSDGMVMAREEGDIGYNTIIGRREELRDNLRRLFVAAELTEEETKEAVGMVDARVKQW